ncbi:MAG: GNAT family N-acetyltransferase [candidate division Zixibacteria bacterium]|nr:GNAT family N-acetyltransferase [candidate division Zixibacteria bacterium]MDH3937339.1 GNAT family N-acetyltransferase [candidate division Zixibacteria bacterium]MDH4033542.1 GNAT family N-acetyltransferase [candidate division Zixibacteria bacterium]
MNIEYHSNYFGEPDAIASFQRYAIAVFGLDFTLWKERGLWDDQYTPFSAFVNGECVASICVYPSQMKVDGRDKLGAQLLTVGTLPEYRKLGIQREIWNRAKAWIRPRCDFVFLFTDESAAGFYERLGLKRQPEFYETVVSPLGKDETSHSFRKLNLDVVSDYSIVERLAHEREMVSDRLGFHTPKLLMFMFLYVYQNRTYYLDDIDTLVVAEEVEDRLRIHDIVATKMPELSAIEGFLAHFNKREIDFLFCADRLGLSKSTRTRAEDDVLFVSDDFQLDGEFVFPYSIRG